MRSALFVCTLALAVVATTTRVTGQGGSTERGKYVVEQVARCQECHTAKTETGEFDRSKWMKGATLIGVPSAPVADWHQKAPDITSTSQLWDRWGQDGFATFLQTAKNPRGGKAGPPMPAYTMSADDANAIAAYLKSLP